MLKMAKKALKAMGYTDTCPHCGADMWGRQCSGFVIMGSLFEIVLSVMGWWKND